MYSKEHSVQYCSGSFVGPSLTRSNTRSSKVMMMSKGPSAWLSCHFWGASFTFMFLLSIRRRPFFLYLKTGK